MKAPFGHWGTQTFIAALGHDGLTAPWVIDGPINRDIFESYIETQLAPTLRRGDMVILDNLSSHKSPKAAAILKARGAWSYSCRPTAPTLTPSKWHLPRSRRTCERQRLEPSTRYGRPSDKSANSNRPTNVGITSRQQVMLQIKHSML